MLFRSDKVGKQVDIQFGTVDFQRLTKSEKSLKSIQPRRLWSDRVEDDEESLPSPLAMSAPPFRSTKEGHAAPCSQAEVSSASLTGTEKSELFSAKASTPTEISAEIIAPCSPVKEFVLKVSRLFSHVNGYAVTPPTAPRSSRRDSPSSTPPCPSPGLGSDTDQNVNGMLYLLDHLG